MQLMINIKLVRLPTPPEWSKVDCGTANINSEKSLRKETMYYDSKYFDAPIIIIL